MNQFNSVLRIPHPHALLPKCPIAAIRLLWLLTILWYELGTFHWSLAGCRWPDAVLMPRDKEGNSASTSRSASPTHVLLITDPQVRAPHEHPAWRLWLRLADFSLRKRWAFARSVRPDVVVFLGDMLDGGRHARDDDEYRESSDYFKSIFSTDSSTTVYYVPGNHDVGLGPSSRVSATQRRRRYSKNFGPLNDRVSVANHTLVILDAPGLVEEDYRRAASGKNFEEWHAPPNGAINFINKFAGGSEESVVLFSHIPLFRPDTAACGPLREKGTIRRGVGPGFQSMLGRDSTSYILRHLRPAVVFSGNDHDYCEYTHSVPLLSEGQDPKIEHIREVTVKAISSSGGIRRPGFQLLSLSPSPASQPDNKSFADVPCFLPDERIIYLTRYLPLLALTLLVLAISAARRHRVKRQRPGSLDLDLDHMQELSLDLDANDASPLSAVSGTLSQLSSSFSQPSPESGMASASLLSAARMSRGPDSTTTLAPTFRAAANNGKYTPNTPDFTVGGGTPSGVRSPGMLAAPTSGIAALPARLRALSDSEETDDDEEGLQMHMPTQLARYRVAPGESDDYFSLTLDRARRRRRLAWTWAFELGGRRRHVSIGVPLSLEHACRVPFTTLRGGPRGGRGNKVSRESPLKTFFDDLVAATWPPALLFSVICFILVK